MSDMVRVIRNCGQRRPCTKGILGAQPGIPCAKTAGETIRPAATCRASRNEKGEIADPPAHGAAALRRPRTPYRRRRLHVAGDA
jgi:hypothetical protein